MSSTVLTALFSAASDRVTATAEVPVADPSRPDQHGARPVRREAGGEPGDGGALVAGVVAERAAGDDEGGVGRADALGAVGHEAGVAQRGQHGVALGVVDRRDLRGRG